MEGTEKIEAEGAVEAQLALGNQMLRILLDLNEDELKDGARFTMDLNGAVFTITIEKGAWTD